MTFERIGAGRHDPLTHEPTSTSRRTIRCAELSDVPTMVDVHQSAFPGFFLTRLGSPFLHEFYCALLADDDGFGFVASDVTRIGGFVAGTAQPAGFYRRLLRQRWWRFALVSLKPVLRQPSIIPRLLRAFSMPHAATQQEGRGTLLSIAVLPYLQGQGFGRALVQTFLHEALRRGLRQIDLTTDRENNEAANHFYLGLGFVCARTFMTPEGRAMNEYVIDLADQR